MLFGSPDLLHGLWGVLALAAVVIVGSRLRTRRLARWADDDLWGRLVPGRSQLLRGTRIGLSLAALAFAVLAAARPQVGARLVQVDRQGIEVVIVLDVSLSMEAVDVVPNRLDRSKQEIREILDGLAGDRVGIVLFAGGSFLLCPLTLDVAAANLFLDAVAADVLPDPGTNLELALRGARDAFGDDEALGGRAVILFTDGEGHEGSVLDIADELQTEGIPVVTVGVGTPNGEPIPVMDAQGRSAGYKKDRGGTVVLSRLDEATLREVSARTGGMYVPATLQGREVGEILEYLGKMKRGELGGTMRRRVDERYQVPAAIASVLWLLALLVPESRRPEDGE